ncbi:unnamed protein product, partial [Mesorhabditis spiculigera]
MPASLPSATTTRVTTPKAFNYSDISPSTPDTICSLSRSSFLASPATVSVVVDSNAITTSSTFAPGNAVDLGKNNKMIDADSSIKGEDINGNQPETREKPSRESED